VNSALGRQGRSARTSQAAEIRSRRGAARDVNEAESGARFDLSVAGRDGMLVFEESTHCRHNPAGGSMRPTMRFCAGLGLLLMIGVFPAGAQETAQETLTPFAPPTQYASLPSKPYDSLLAANVKWMQAKIVDRKRKRRFQLNNLRLPGADKPKIQALVDQLDAELKDATATLMVLKARQPDVAAQHAIVKANVTEWIKALNQRVDGLRSDAAEAAERAKKAIKQFEAATAQADAADDKQTADNLEKEAKQLADDLGAAGL
jgi:hypothetical protein